MPCRSPTLSLSWPLVPLQVAVQAPAVALNCVRRSQLKRTSVVPVALSTQFAATLLPVCRQTCEFKTGPQSPGRVLLPGRDSASPDSPVTVAFITSPHVIFREQPAAFQRSRVGLGSAGCAAYCHPTAKSHQAGNLSLAFPAVESRCSRLRQRNKDRSRWVTSLLCLFVKGIERLL